MSCQVGAFIVLVQSALKVYMVSIVWLEGSEKEIWCHGFFLLSSHFSSLPRIGGTEKVTEKI